MRDVKVSPTGYAVLGLLSFGHSLSGYALRRWAADGVGPWYTVPAQSQIYRELGRLESIGWVTSTDVAQTDRPDKRTYTITDGGRAALAAWVVDAPTSPPSLKHHPMLRLFLTHDLDVRTADALTATVREHRDRVRQVLDDLETQSATLHGEPDGGFASVVFDWAAELYRGDLRGTEIALKAIDDRRPPDDAVS